MSKRGTVLASVTVQNWCMIVHCVFLPHCNDTPPSIKFKALTMCFIATAEIQRDRELPYITEKRFNMGQTNLTNAICTYKKYASITRTNMRPSS